MFDGRTLPPWLDADTTHLEMTEAPRGTPPPAPDGAEVRYLPSPDPAFYRWLYNDVGADWLWCYRLVMPDTELATILADPQVAVHVLYHHGAIAGYIELDAGQPDATWISYFGLRPGFTGRGLGSWFLDWGVRRAWADGATRLRVHTCNWDSPAALPTYRKVGFVPYQRTVEPLENRAWFLPHAS